MMNFVHSKSFKIQTFKNPTFIHRLQIKSRRGSSVAWSGRSARKDGPWGPSGIPYHYGRAQHSHHHLQYIYQATAKPSLEGGAETKPPREKSSISAISQIQN